MYRLISNSKEYGEFSTKELAEKAQKMLPKEDRADSIIVSIQELNTVKIDGKVIDLTENGGTINKDHQVLGYATLDIDDIAECGDFDAFLNMLEEKVDIGLISGLSYNVVSGDGRSVTFQVEGYIEDDDEYDEEVES